MKKFIFVCLMIIVSCLLCACYDPHRYSHDGHFGNIKSVELIDYENNDENISMSLQTENKVNYLEKFDFSKVTVLETLSQERFEEFSQALSKIRLQEKVNFSTAPKGVSLKITLKDDTFEVISPKEGALGGLCAIYNSNGEPMKFIDGFGKEYFDKTFSPFFDYLSK